MDYDEEQTMEIEALQAILDDSIQGMPIVQKRQFVCSGRCSFGVLNPDYDPIVCV